MNTENLRDRLLLDCFMALKTLPTRLSDEEIATALWFILQSTSSALFDLSRVNCEEGLGKEFLWQLGIIDSRLFMSDVIRLLDCVRRTDDMMTTLMTMPAPPTLKSK